MSRTCSTSMSQRDVIHAQGHAGSNHIDTDREPGARPALVVAAVLVLAAEVRLPVRVAVAVMMGILSPRSGRPTTVRAWTAVQANRIPGRAPDPEPQGASSCP